MKTVPEKNYVRRSGCCSGVFARLSAKLGRRRLSRATAAGAHYRAVTLVPPNTSSVQGTERERGGGRSLPPGYLAGRQSLWQGRHDAWRCAQHAVERSRGLALKTACAVGVLWL